MSVQHEKYESNDNQYNSIMRFLSQGNLLSAEKEMGNFLSRFGQQDPNVLCAQAYLDAYRQRPNESMGNLRQLLQKDSRHIAGIFLLGQLMDNAGRIHDAVQAYTFAAKLAPQTSISQARDKSMEKLLDIYFIRTDEEDKTDNLIQKKKEFQGIVEKISQKMIGNPYAKLWLTGAIFPTELVFFMAKCELLGVKNIIECGRQDGYSTEVLAEFVEERGGQLISIDWELEVERAAACRKRLERYKNLSLEKGDAFAVFPGLLPRVDNQPYACLFDGPKGWPAALLGLGSALNPNLKLLSMHNEPPKTELSARLRSLSRTPTSIDEHMMFEDKADFPNWNALHDMERHLYRHDAEMESDILTLLCLDLDEADRAMLAWLTPTGRPGLTPALLRMLSKHGQSNLMQELLKSLC